MPNRTPISYGLGVTPGVTFTRDEALSLADLVASSRKGRQGMGRFRYARAYPVRSTDKWGVTVAFAHVGEPDAVQPSYYVVSAAFSS